MQPYQKPSDLHIRRRNFESMRCHVDQQAPKEACGLLAGKIEPGKYRAFVAIPATNILQSTTNYRIDPEEQLNAFKLFEALDLDLVGIYHSHPNGPDIPSQTDIAEAYYPEVVHLIWSGSSGKWRAGAFLIQDGTVLNVSLLVE